MYGNDPGVLSRRALFFLGALLSAIVCGSTVSAETMTEVRFRFRPSMEARVVTVAGTFNDWNPNATALSDSDRDGIWEIVLRLAPDRYLYKFVVNGTEWFTDQSATEFVDDGFGGKNSVLEVGSEPMVVGELGQATGEPAGTEVTFRFRPEEKPVNAVSVAGTFNDWNAAAHVLADADGDGIWELTLRLEPGSYAYQFVLDGDRWRSDRNAAGYEDDGFGGRNALFSVGGEGMIVGMGSD